MLVGQRLSADIECLYVAGVFGGALIVSYIMGFAVYQFLLRMQVLDCPNKRSSHAIPTPRGGGVGIMLVVWAGLALFIIEKHALYIGTIVIASIWLAAVSFIDDRHSVPWRIRMGVQAVAASMAVAALWANGPRPAWYGVAVGSPCIVLLITGYANAYNFMDGINGIAAGQALVAGVGTAMVAIAAGLSLAHPATTLSLLVAGAAAGFLPHNFPRARMFMGDVSSVPLGFLLAVTAIWIASEKGWWLLLPLACIHANFALDTTITLFRRWRRGERLYEAHREHFYQRLVRAGWSHFTVTGWEMGLQVIIIVLAYLATLNGRAAGVWLVAIVIGIWLAFFSICEQQFRRKVI